jgi:inhibitor of cysteine peptidase
LAVRNFFLRALVIALVAAIPLHATGAISAAAEKATTMQTLTEADNDRTIELRVGDSVRVSLPENATTGYRWAIDRLDQQIVEAVGSEPHYPGGAVGAGGEVTFTFKATKPGAGDITLKHWRHFEGDSSVTKRFHLRLNARP